MSEKRKPIYTIVLKKPGKPTNKVEVFRRSLWLKSEINKDGRAGGYWRLRVNGKWWPAGEMKFVTKTQLKELFFKNLKEL